MGYKFQFITLAGWHSINMNSPFGPFALNYKNQLQWTAYVDLREREFAAEAQGYTATKHQREVGTGAHFDLVLQNRNGWASVARSADWFDRNGSSSTRKTECYGRERVCPSHCCWAIGQVERAGLY
jgi:isocitrate lyase